MSRRRRRGSAAVLAERAMKDIRKLHRAHLREVSAILSNALGFPVRVSLVKQEVVEEKPRKRRGPRVARSVGEVAGYGESPLPALSLPNVRMDWPAFERFMGEDPEGEEPC